MASHPRKRVLRSMAASVALAAFKATHGQSKPLLDGSVLRMSCSSQALDAGSIPVTRSTAKPSSEASYSIIVGGVKAHVSYTCHQLTGTRTLEAHAVLSECRRYPAVTIAGPINHQQGRIVLQPPTLMCKHRGGQPS